MKLNDNYMRKKHGQKVLFGEIIQVSIKLRIENVC